MFSWHYSDRSGWFRVFGRGLKVRDSRRWPLLFSEREGYTRVWRFGPWVIGGVFRG